MKKSLFLMTLLMCLSLGASAQWVWLPMDTTNTNEKWSGYFASGDPQIHYTNISNEPNDKVEGSSSMKVDYKIHASEGWGGYTVRVYANDPTAPNSRYDLSSGKYLSYWYKTVTPAVATKPSADIHFEVKLKEKADPNKGEDRWLKSNMDVLTDQSGQWHQVIIPLEQSEWSMQAGDDNKTFDTWAIFGVELAFVYIIDGSTETAAGTVLLDKFQILGQKFEPIMSFNESEVADTTSNRTAKDAFWQLNDMSWDGSAGARHMILSKETVDTAQAPQALKVDYSVVGSQDWGGYAELEHIFPTEVNIKGKSAIAFYVKNLEANGLTGRMALRMDFTDVVDGASEMWTSMANVDLDKTSDWQLVVMPIFDASDLSQPVKPKKADGVTNKEWYDLRFGDRGFVKREGGNDGIFTLDKIKKIRIGFIIFRDNGAPFGPTTIASGKFLIDFMTPSGFKNVDETGPEAPTDVAGIPLDFSNIVSWTDVPNENGETYRAFFSQNPITSLDDPSVKTLGFDIAKGTGAKSHYLYAPLINREMTWYYAAAAKDNAGNPGKLSASSEAVTNKGYGIPIISSVKPNGFAADGNLKEWSGIKPFVVNSTDGVSHTKGSVDNDHDLWFKSWIAVSNDSLYVAYEVHDDIIVPDTTKNTYEVDSPDLFISAYPYMGKDHGSYKRGFTPDYHFRFNLKKATNDQNGSTVSRVEASNYEYKITSDTTYVVEWGFPLTSLAALNAGDMPFSVQDGQMIGFDILVNDADATGTREGYRIWSPDNDDNSWSSVANWAYTWYGHPGSVFENGNGVFVSSNSKSKGFELNQNYPNPFNPSTAITFTVQTPSNVTLKVYNVLGAEIATIVNDYRTAGKHTVNFDGSQLSSGIYFVKMNANGYSSTRKIMLMK